MRISGIISESIVDGPGIRLVVFFQGCSHNCLGCHNPDTHSFSGGKEITVDEIIDKIEKAPYLDGITLSGGDPFFQVEEMLKLLKIVKEKTNVNVWVYSGYTFEEIIELGKKKNEYLEVIKYIDVLVDGRFIFEKRDISLQYKGSTNQRIIDVIKSREMDMIVEYSLIESV